MDKSYNIYMIVMDNHPISLMYSRITIPTWEKHDYKIKKFNAITPKDLYKKSKLEFSNNRARKFTNTEKAVWYSHFELWCKCLNDFTPMVIIEHDSKLVKPLPDLSKEGHKFLSFIDRDFGKKRGIYLAPGSGYYITPIVAQRLISYAVSKPIMLNSDGHLANLLNIDKQEKAENFYYIEQINIDGLNTIDHKNPDRNYVGLDYEEIDIPSIHRQEI